jgi:hypothetical protein
LPGQFAPILIHAQRGAQHTGAGIGQADSFQGALDDAILATPAVQNDKNPVEAVSIQAFPAILARIHPMGVDAPPA